MRAVLLLVLLPICFCDDADNAYDVVLTKEEKLEKHDCKENEVWMDCASCEQKCGEEPPKCPRICQPARCHCPAHKGFKRAASGDCVSKC